MKSAYVENAIPRRTLQWGDFGLFSTSTTKVSRQVVEAFVANAVKEAPSVTYRLSLTQSKAVVGGPPESDPQIALEANHCFIELADIEPSAAQRVSAIANDILGVAVNLCADTELDF